MKPLNTNFLLLLSLSFILLLTSSCAPTIVGQSGRTNGKNVSSFSGNFNINGKYFEENSGFLPQGEAQVKYQYGVGEKVDFSLANNTNGGFLFDTKIQVIGDQESFFAASIGGGLSYTGFLGAFVPIYLSIHPNENISIYGAARYFKLSFDPEETERAFTSALGFEAFITPRTSIVLEGTAGLEKVYLLGNTAIFGGGLGLTVRFGKGTK